MSAKCLLSCNNPNQQLELPLTDILIDMSSIDFSKCVAVFEDGRYNIHFFCDEYKRSNLDSVEVCVNGETIGVIDPSARENIISGDIIYRQETIGEKPFLLHYDLVTLSFVLLFSDGTKKEYYSDFLLCVSKNPEDVSNIQKMLEELIAFDDSQVGEWIFSNVEQGASNSLYEGKWNKRSYKSLSSYIQLLEQILSCYKNNYAYFKLQGKHTISHSNVLVSYENVKNISRESFNWILQNTDQLAQVPYKSGIQYQGKNYLPYHIRTDARKKSWDVYENRVVVNFLYTTLFNAKQIYTEFDNDVLNEERIISRLHGSFPKEYRASIITIKSLQISFCRILLGKLNKAIDSFKNIYNQYIALFDISGVLLTSFPKKTSTFCEIKPYSQIFETIVLWFRYGEYSLEKDRLILQVKTLDKLFEYYCLLKLLELLADNGFQRADIDKPVYKHAYTLADSLYKNEKDVANTYILSRGELDVTVYYQPVISAISFENNLSLYRTTKHIPNYYTPDFVLKFSSHEHEQNEEYVIFDAKFSSRINIKNHSLPDVIRKYSCEVGVAAENRAPKMVWILQGRVNSSENSIWKYHNSVLASKFRPITSFGIVSINTSVGIKQRLWDEIKSNISLL